VLVALSCVTVLGIAMVAFLAVSNQAMKLSNRGYAQTISRNLAELGLERGLRAFNDNSFSGWTLANATTASLALTVSSDRYGTSGISAAANVRVDHYWDTRKATVWSALPTYAVNDFVWYQGVWYLCKSVPVGREAPSNTTYWTAAPDNWSPYANYRIGNIAVSGGSAYRCTADHIGQTPPNASYWTAITAASWSAATAYAVDEVAWSGGLPYRCIVAHTNQAPPNASYWLGAPVIYSEGIATLPEGGGTTIKTQLRATLAPAPLFPNALGATKDIIMNSSGYIDSYNSVLGAYSAAPATTNRGSSAVVAGGDTAVSNAVALANMRVYGYLAATSNNTSPYAPRYTSSSSSFVTGNMSATAGSPPTPRIDLTRVTRSPHVPRFEIQTVSGANVLPNGTTVLDDNATTLGTAGASSPAIYSITGTYDSGTAILRDGLYLDDAADVLTIDGPVILKVTGQLGMDAGKITISATGSLEIYFTGQFLVESGSTNGIQNLTLDPKKCLIAGTSTDNTYGDHYYRSTLPFYGVIYMPDAYFSTFTNGVFYGAISGKNVRFPNSGMAFHYDTSLRTAGRVGTFIDGPYLTAEIRELSDVNERVTLP
jgi:hypothetical protein